MAEEIDVHLSVRIVAKLRVLSPISPHRSIYKVQEHLRMVNKQAYEPQVLAIGPYHRGKSYLNAMEEHKKRYLKSLLQRRGENDVTRYITTMRALERKARACYAESVGLETDEFVEMMLLDASFIVELLRKDTLEALRDENDPLFEIDWIGNALCRDLLLVENQLPLFLLHELFRMTSTPDDINSFGDVIFDFFNDRLPQGIVPEGLRQATEDTFQNIGHLVGLLHAARHPMTSASAGYWEFIRCATKLKEAGIRFKKAETDSLFAITFENGVMEIPGLIIGDRTDGLFRNLIAYEQFFYQNPNYVTDYVRLMDCLIDSPKDVELLCQCGIIDNWLGNDEVVANMFNRLCDSVILSSSNFYYTELFNKVNTHCDRRWNKWMENLRHNYFKTPWAIISVLGAVLLLLLTLVQTVFSVLAYYK